MKLTYLFYIAICLTILDPGMAGAQPRETYQKCKILLSAGHTMQKLAACGVETDHGLHKPGRYFISGFSESEISRIKAAGFGVEVLVADVVKDFERRNMGAEKKVTGGIAISTGTCNKVKRYKTPVNWKYGTMGGHLKYEEMLAQLDSMRAKFPALITARLPIDTTKTHEGRTIWQVKISDNPTVNEPAEPQGLYSAVHHAREPVGMHQLVFFMWYLLENYASNPDIKALIDNSELYFVPCLNPDGYIFNQTQVPNGGGMWRKNRRDNGDGSMGVDLNRNYGYNWGFDDFGSSPDPFTDTYRGTEGFSEPETRAMKAFCERQAFKIGLNYHTYSNLVIHPWGYADLQCEDSTLFRNLTREMTRENNYRIGTGMQVLNYNSNGSSDDFMYAETPEKGKIMAMTPEVGDWFWPTQDEILELCIENLHQNLTAARALHPLATVRDSTGLFLAAGVVPNPGNYRIRYKVVRNAVNSAPATFTVTWTPFGPGSAGMPSLSKTYSNLQPNQVVVDSVIMAVGNVSLDNPNPVQWEVKISNGLFAITDTVIHAGSQPYQPSGYTESCDESGSWSGNWIIASGNQVEGTGCLKPTDGDYEPAMNSYMRRIAPFDLRATSIRSAEMSFWTNFSIEKNFDYASLEFSTDSGQSWSVVCTDRSVLSSPFSQQAGPNTIIPIWDGYQDTWAKEYINLQEYLGKKLWIRFFFHSDDFTEFSGFMVDDIRVKIGTDILQTASSNSLTPLHIWAAPNPAQSQVRFSAEGLAPGQSGQVTIADGLGKIVERFELEGNASQSRNLKLPSGIYFIRLQTSKGFTSQKLMIK